VRPRAVDVEVVRHPDHRDAAAHHRFRPESALDDAPDWHVALFGARAHSVPGRALACGRRVQHRLRHHEVGERDSVAAGDGRERGIGDRNRRGALIGGLGEGDNRHRDHERRETEDEAG